MSKVTQQKVFTGDADAFGFLSFSVFDGEGNVSVVDTFDARITDSTFVNVSPQVFDRIVTIAEVFDIGVPVNFPAGIDDRLLSNSLLLKLSEQQVLKSFGEDLAPDEPLFFSDYESAVRVESASRNNKVDMRVQAQILLPGLQNTEESGCSAEVFGIGQNVFNGLGGAAKK